MHRAAIGIALVALAGCPGGGPEGGDGGVDARPDAGPTSGGLAFEMGTAPDVTGTVGPVTIDEVRVSLRDVRAIGDSAPGDMHTYLSSLSLEWKEGEDPGALEFPEAPPGRYSSLQARMGGGEDDYRIRGTVMLTGGDTVSFEIRDDASSLPIAIPLTGVIVDRDPVIATITMSLSFLSSVGWEDVPPDGGEIKIEPGDPRLPAISAAVAGSFSLTGVR